MADDGAYAECPYCRQKKFRYVDETPVGYYRRPVFECTKCGRRWKETELKGIEWVEAAF